MTSLRLTWNRGLLIAGLFALLVAGLIASRQSDLGCGDLVARRWSLPLAVIGGGAALAGIGLLLAGWRLSPDRAQSAGQGLLIAALSAALTLGLLDVAMRLTDPPYARAQSLYQNHAVLGYFFSPNQTYESNATHGEYREVFYFDANGLVIRGEPNDPRPDATRILFLGDSMLRGIEVDAEANLSVVAARAIEQATGRDTQQINLGVSGYSPTQYYLSYQSFKDTYDPQAVVALVYAGNDFTEDARLYLDRRVLFGKAQQPSALIPQNDYAAGTWWSAYMGSQPLKEARPRLMSRDRWRGGVLNLIRDLVIWPLCKSLDRAAFQPAPAATLDLPPLDSGDDLTCLDLSGDLTPVCQHYARRAQTLIRNNLDAVFKETYTSLDESDIQYALDALRLLADAVRADGRDLLIVIVPVNNQIPGQGAGLKPLRGMEPDQVIDSTRPQAILMDFCAAENLRCIDLLPLFLDHADEQLYWVFDTHLTPRGHDLIGQTIAEALLEEQP